MNAAKRATAVLAAAAITLSLSACGTGAATSAASPSPAEEVSATYEGERSLVLSDDQVTLDGLAIAEEDAGDVTVSHDIVYYESGQGSDYGEGAEADEHDAEEARAHTVVTIRSAGTYRLSGTLSQGQIAIDLGDDAEDDPDAVVTLILDGVDVTCTVAPALIFYNVYECGSSDEETATSDVDTSAAGANVIIADGSVNNFDGSHVARIYEPGTTDKLHKYDGAFYSKMSMNVSGEIAGDGVLNITGDNEGLDTELHLTINGGVINIDAANDGINTNEDNVSVTTINGGTLNIDAGLGSEGDSIDSNGLAGRQRRQRFRQRLRGRRRQRHRRLAGNRAQRRHGRGSGQHVRRHLVRLRAELSDAHACRTGAKRRRGRAYRRRRQRSV